MAAQIMGSLRRWSVTWWWLAVHLKSANPSFLTSKVSLQAGSYEELVKYLLMVRKKHKDSKVDTELVYAYGKTKQLGPLEEFISSPHQANLQVSQAGSWSFLAWGRAGQCPWAAGRWCEEAGGVSYPQCLSNPHLG